MHVKVTQEHIDKANQLINGPSYQTMARCCPVSVAVCDLLGLEIGQVVSYTHINILSKYSTDIRSLAVPDAVLEWMEAYDDGKPVQPIEFDVEDY